MFIVSARLSKGEGMACRKDIFQNIFKKSKTVSFAIDQAGQPIAMRHFDDVFINNLEGSFPLFIGSLHIGTPEVTTGDRWCALAIGLNSRDLLHIHRNDRNSACTSAWRFF